jgi:DNA-binding Xre family transcriptional regulator
MLTLNLSRVFALRGIEKPYTELVKCGISRPTAHNLLSLRVTSIKYSHLEKICELLNCEPNDLFESFEKYSAYRNASAEKPKAR